jgi:hypothetical protein
LQIQTHKGERQMEDDSTTDAANNQSDSAASTATSTDSAASTEQQTADTGDNLDTSKSTDDSAGGDKSTDDSGDDKAPTTFDTDLDDWAEKRNGAKPTTDVERQALQELRDKQREYTRNQQSKDANKEISKSIKDVKLPDGADQDDDTFEDPVTKRQDAIEAQLAEERNLRVRSEYFTDKGVTMEESKVMGEILKEKVAKGGKSALDYWTNPDNLEDWHSLAQARLMKSTDNSAVADAAAQKERERIAKESKANGPSRNASTTSTSDKSEEAKRLERFTNW